MAQWFEDQKSQLVKTNYGSKLEKTHQALHNRKTKINHLKMEPMFKEISNLDIIIF